MSKADDIVLSLTNNQVTYKKLLPAVQKYIFGKWPYMDFRQMIFRIIREHYDRTWSSASVDETSLVCFYIFKHYYEEATNEQWRVGHIQTFYNSCPLYARAAIEKYSGYVFVVPAKDGHSKQSDACFYTDTQPTIKETQMSDCTNAYKTDKPTNIPAVEVRTLIFGRNIKDMSDTDVFEAIAELEKQINKFNGLQNKPKRIEAKIAELTAQIAAIVIAADAQ